MLRPNCLSSGAGSESISCIFRSPTAPSVLLLHLQMGIVGEMRETGTKMADSLAAVGERLGMGGKKE